MIGSFRRRKNFKNRSTFCPSWSNALFMSLWDMEYLPLMANKSDQVLAILDTWLVDSEATFHRVSITSWGTVHTQTRQLHHVRPHDRRLSRRQWVAGSAARNPSICETLPAPFITFSRYRRYLATYNQQSPPGHDSGDPRWRISSKVVVK